MKECEFSWVKRVEIEELVPCGEKHLESLFEHFNVKAQVKRKAFYRVAGNGEVPSPEAFEKVVWDQALQRGHFEAPKAHHDFYVSVSYLPGVTDNSGKALEEAFSLFGFDTRCFSGTWFEIDIDHKERTSPEMLKKAIDHFCEEVGNPLIQKVTSYHNQKDGEERLKWVESRFSSISLPQVHIDHDQKVEMVSLELSEEELEELSRKRCLALNLEEMTTIKNYYLQEKVVKRRQGKELPLWPTDVELEVLAQTWSEHCKHKIFAANIEYHNEETQEKLQIESLYKSYIKKATKEIEEEGVDWLVSVFSDNAGIVRFDQNIDLCIKVETHNSPSALDPYGGAITGILGVNRDILGCGLGAKPIANTDVFCFASTELPEKVDPLKLPAGLMEPERLLRGVHKGVEDGGNKSGIPTVNGAIVFDTDYAGKPLVFCGTIGTLPAMLKDGREGSEKGAKVGDGIFVVGGAVGADGIHGATFSSMELNEDSPATAVQIGDPLTQKRVMDFLLEARDLGLYTCVTDNGAGGISSSIGEMAELTGGAQIDLNTHPRKYPGLSPWEIMISESQERMTFAVDSSKESAFLELANERGVMATRMGQFTDSGYLEVFYKEELVADLEMAFLHDGVPTLNLKARSVAQKERPTWINLPKEAAPKTFGDTLVKLLHCENIASKEPWVRQYDHEVQGATIGKPFSGKNGIGPGDSGVLDLEAHGGEKDSLVTVGCGLAPRMSSYNAEVMAKLAVDEAVRNIIVSGTNPQKICLLDNFCWPDPVLTEKNPQGDIKLGQLVDTCRGLYEICKLYKAPLVSGKDSMKNDFRGKNRAGEPLTISIQPTLLVTAMGHGNKSRLIRSSLKEEGSLVYRLGYFQASLLVSEYRENFDVSSENLSFEGEVKPESWDFNKCHQTYQAFYQANELGLLQCAHDISDGGLGVALAEMLFDEGLGFSFTNDKSIGELFGEGPGMILVGVNSKNQKNAEEFFSQAHVPFELLGQTNHKALLEFSSQKSVSIEQALKSWRRNWEVSL
jgi:phosphoribosylformylglycinamidine synthase II